MGDIHLDREIRGGPADTGTLGQPPMQSLKVVAKASAHMRIRLRTRRCGGRPLRRPPLERTVLAVKAAIGIRELTVAATLSFRDGGRRLPMRSEFQSLDRLPTVIVQGRRSRKRSALVEATEALAPLGGEDEQLILRVRREREYLTFVGAWRSQALGIGSRMLDGTRQGETEFVKSGGAWFAPAAPASSRRC